MVVEHKLLPKTGSVQVCVFAPLWFIFVGCINAQFKIKNLFVYFASVQKKFNKIDNLQ